MLTQEYLRKIFDYDSETGILTWKYRTDIDYKGWNARFAYKEAGAIVSPGGKPRRQTYVNYKGYLNSRLIWLWCHGEPIPKQIDHKDTNTLNDRIDNLRAATHTTNKWNTGIRKNNTSGIKGVSWQSQRSKWQARIDVDGKTIHLGLFETIEEATTTRRNAAEKYHGEYVRHE